MSLPLHRRFKSGSEWEPIGFFSDSLCEAKTFDLMLGFFSSSAINILSDGFATFLYHGGQMRMIINDILSEDDKKAIMVGEESVELPYFDLHNIEKIQKTLSDRDKHFFECLSFLIRNNRIDIKIIAPKDQNGISHTKSGVFSDGTNYIAFEGSCNFSRTALVENIESFTVTCDWDGPQAVANIEEIKRDFEETFSEQNDTVRYESVNDIKTRIVDTFGNKDATQLLIDEYKILKNKNNINLSATVKKVLKRARNNVEKILLSIKPNAIMHKEPKYPYPDGPRKEYQEKAYNNWASKERGLFNMATGTGKTVTALNVLLHLYKKEQYYQAIIIVPTVTLVSQWENACHTFHFDNVIQFCSNNSDRIRDLDELINREELVSLGLANEQSFVIITTYASFIKQSTFKKLNESFDENKVLIIADECHNMGANNISKLLSYVNYKRRIGLSATPDRQFDDKGNEMINNFFGIENGEYTFLYTMKEAIDNNVLCHYYYYPHVVYLDDKEMKTYKNISSQIVKFFHPKEGVFTKDNPMLTSLLLKRKRIIHKASAKEGVFRQIIKDLYKQKKNLKYTLVYVPEGLKNDDVADVFEDSDSIPNDNEAKHLIDRYTAIVSSVSSSTTVVEFTANSKNRDVVLDKFAKGEIEVLTSMKCLDEGVDVPRSETAIFCASTGNPRQFIQRRGRILRTHPDKKMAVIHDLVVAPYISENEETFKMERNLLMNEIRRVKDFSSLSDNEIDTEIALDDLISHYHINFYN